MSLIPPFHPHSEALMSNLASRTHEWSHWEIRELLFEIPSSAKSKGSRKIHFRIVLRVQWKTLGPQTYVLRQKSSPTQTLLSRKTLEKNSLRSARILAKKVKDSLGAYRSTEAELIDKFLTP